MDNTYLERIELRRGLLANLTTELVDGDPIATPAVREFYTWVFGTYLPQRFPTMFSINSTTSSATLRNLVTDDLIPISASLDVISCLRTIGAHIDDDFLFLLPDPSAQNQYVLRAYITCFPSGFDTRRKFNRTLTAIHAPIPGYASKLDKSMDRFFTSLPCGKVVKRHNWTVTTHRQLHKLSGNHGSAHEDVQKARDEVDLSQTVLRAERQTLHRLWETGALVFAFKTYQYELADIKEEGNGEAMAQAVEGLARGSVPDMNVYKRGAIWGDKVVDFLRS